LEKSQSMPLGVVLERRKSDNQWIDFDWSVVAVLPGAAEIDDWIEIRKGDDWVQYHAGTLPLEIFRKETEGYKYNLTLEQPSVFIVLREAEDEDEEDLIPFLVTVCPYEAQDYLDSSEEIVESIAMPDSVAAWLADYIEEHHVDEPFKKRKRVPFDPRKEGFDKPPPRIQKKWNKPAHE
jgi:hypothetical protein